MNPEYDPQADDKPVEEPINVPLVDKPNSNL